MNRDSGFVLYYFRQWLTILRDRDRTIIPPRVHARIVFFLLHTEQEADGWSKHLTKLCSGRNFFNIISYVSLCQKIPFFSWNEKCREVKFNPSPPHLPFFNTLVECHSSYIYNLLSVESDSQKFWFNITLFLLIHWEVNQNQWRLAELYLWFRVCFSGLCLFFVIGIYSTRLRIRRLFPRVSYWGLLF